MGIVRRYRLLALSVLLAASLLGFLSFFFVFLLAPVVPLGLFYLGYLVLRGRRSRSDRPAERVLLAHEAAARQRRLHEGA